MRKALTVLALAMAASVLSGCNDKISDKDIEYIPLAQVRMYVQEKPGVARLLDPRPPQDFVKGHIPGAENLQLSQVSEDKDSIDPALARYKLLIVYGDDPGSGVAGAMTKRLMRAGASDVKMFAGGLAEWSRAGLPVEKSPASGSAEGGGGAGKTAQPANPQPAGAR